MAESELRAVAVELDGSKLAADAYMVDGRTMVPLRAIFERLNATVEWDDVNKAISATKDTKVIWLAIGNTEAKIGGNPVTLDVPPMLIHGQSFVPLRFVSEALGAQVTFDGESSTAKVSTGSSCGAGGQVHSGTISGSGETWGVCGSPHFVKGDFMVEGLESPILTIEAGAVVRFESEASLIIGQSAPGGLVISGTSEKPVVLTADSAGPNAGFWKGIRFFEKTLRGNATIEGARIEYAGGYEGALYLDAATQRMEVTVKNSEWKNTLFAGIQMKGMARLSERSMNLTISGTKTAQEGGGFPIITDLVGSHLLPKGNYTGNDIDSIRITSYQTYDEMKMSTTWSHVGVPYDSDISIVVAGPANPTLTIEPGVVTKWAIDTGIEIGHAEQGGLMAVGTKEKPIVFTAKKDKPGSWTGISFREAADKKNNQLQHVVVEYAINGVTLEDDIGPIVKDAVLRSNKEHGVYMPNYEQGHTDYRTGLNNTFKDNGTDQNME
ncbi:copper amine oxidase N-terminal domain-containing protein [Paenibacillus sp. WST5]|uniref:Copper amine oxidase N-terminal domain-containing protein n=2 Tax=Paenibacillus sedimenti TaxID=2770274 RepID=A0A926KX62_9BACL|nr:copper amine oxidase N-terminal domain-containing protein [Paenibacillus sedimenti]